VDDFTIEYPTFGKITFAGQTDITDLDLRDLVTLSNKCVEVYDDDRHVKPPVGKKLNKEALITLYQIFCN